MIQELKHVRKFLLIENLYTSRTLARLAYKEKALIHRVEIIHQRNVLKQVVQKEKKSKKIRRRCVSPPKLLSLMMVINFLDTWPVVYIIPILYIY